MKVMLFTIFFSSALFSNVEYHTLLEEFPSAFGRKGSWKNGEIEVTTDKKSIEKIEKLCAQRFIRMGYSKAEAEKHSKIGVVAEDHYWVWVRDAVTFPGGVPGVYNRILWKTGLSGTQGVVIMPIMPNKKILAIANFRHATRSWELELPRGGRNPTESEEQAAQRELIEETGWLAKTFINLGSVCPDSGMLSGAVPVYLAHVNSLQARHLDEGEAIARNIELSIEEIQEAFDRGFIITDINGKRTKVYCRDPFLSFAIMRSTWKKLL